MPVGGWDQWGGQTGVDVGASCVGCVGRNSSVVTVRNHSAIENIFTLRTVSRSFNSVNRLNEMSRDARKPVFGVSDQVRHKSACAVTEAG